MQQVTQTLRIWNGNIPLFGFLNMIKSKPMLLFMGYKRYKTDEMTLQ